MSFFSKVSGKNDADGNGGAPKAGSFLSALSMHLRGELDWALAAYAGISQKEPGDRLAPFFAAAILAARGSMPEAVQNLRLLSRDVAAAGDNISRVIAVELAGLLGDESVGVRVPAVAEVVVGLGDVLKQHGLLNEAAVCFEIACGLTPDNAHVLHRLGDTLHDLRMFDYAESVLQDALNRAPNHWGAIYTYALLLQDMGRNDEALTYYEKAIKLDPNHAKCRNNYGAVLLNLGRLDEALAQCSAADELDPSAPLVKNNLGYIHMLRQDYEAARACFAQAISLNENLFPAYFGLASAERSLTGDPKRIQDLYLKAIEINPTAAEVHHALGGFLATQNDQQALLHFSTAAVLNGTLKDLHKDYGFACLKFGRKAQALEQFRIALDQNPDDELVREMIEKTEAEIAVRH